MNKENEAEQTPKRKFKKRWLVWLGLILLLGPDFYFRSTSFARKVVNVERPQQYELRKFDGSLKIVAWNIAHGRGATDDNWAEDGKAKESRIGEIAKLVANLDADIVVLNEVDFCATWSGGFDQAEAIAKAAGFPYFVKQSNLDFGMIYGRWHFGNVVMSRFPIRQPKVVELATVNAWEDWLVGAKRGVECTIELSPDNRISMIGVHMEARNEEVRVKQARDLALRCKELDYPIFLAGDLNTTPRPFPRAKVTRADKNAFEELVKPSATGLSYRPMEMPKDDELTFPSGSPTKVIDWVLYEDQEFEWVSQKVVSTLLSDHLPVVAEFRLED